MAYICVNQVDEILKKLLPCDTVAADSKNDFNERMKTFFSNEEKHWLLKPTSLSPSVCSRYGWKCVDKDILSCVTCSETLCVKLPHIWNSLAYDKCEKETIKSLQTAHRKHCPWGLAPSPENFVHMEPVHKGQAYQEFLNRLESLIQLKENLPAIKEGICDIMGLSDASIASLCRLTRIPNDKMSRSAMIMACTGWIKSHVSERNCVICLNCHRTVSLSFFVPAQCVSEGEQQTTTDLTSDDSSRVKSENGVYDKSDDDDLTPSKRSRVEPPEPFDPLYEHRHWCLWVIPGKSKESITQVICKDEKEYKTNVNQCTTQPGWKIYLDCLLRNLDSSFGEMPSPLKPTPEKLRKIRQMLESWKPDSVERVCSKP